MVQQLHGSPSTSARTRLPRASASPTSKSPASIPEPFSVWSGALATAGDVVFYGTLEGFVKAVDAKSGKEVWNFELPRNRYPYSASPVLVEGKLYLTREDGTTFVVKVGAKPELVATNALSGSWTTSRRRAIR